MRAAHKTPSRGEPSAAKLLYLDGPGLGLSVRGGLLIVKAPPIESMVINPQTHNLQCVILAAPGFVTTDALAWLDAEHIAAFVITRGEILTIVNSASGQLARKELDARRRQMECILDPKRKLAAARMLIDAKIKTLGLDPVTRRTLARKGAKASSIEDAMIVETEAGAAYWRGWKDQALTFKDGTQVEFNTRARSWRTGRLGETGRQFGNRFALHPVNAMINYAGAIVVTQRGRAQG